MRYISAQKGEEKCPEKLYFENFPPLLAALLGEGHRISSYHARYAGVVIHKPTLEGSVNKCGGNKGP